MFAFSEIIAGGNKVSAVTAEMDRQNNSGYHPDEEAENNAILALSDTLPGNVNEAVVTEKDDAAEKAEA